MQKNRKAQNKVKSLVNLMKVKKNVMTIISIILTISLILLYVIDCYDIPSRLGIPHDYNWLSYIGSLIGSWATIYGVAQTLKFERENSEINSKNEVMPLFNITGNIYNFHYNEHKPEKSYLIFEKTQYNLYLSDEENRKREPMHRFTVNNRIGCYHEFKVVDQNIEKYIQSSYGPKVFLKIRNIGLGHAIINKFIFPVDSGEDYIYELKSEERFSIDVNTANTLLLYLPLCQPKTMEIYFQDVLKTEYFSTIKMEYMEDLPSEYPIELVSVKQYEPEQPIINFKVLSNVYFEDYFPKEVTKLNENRR